jgi:hypothetical protein
MRIFLYLESFLCIHTGIRNPGKISKGILPGLQLQKCIHIAVDAIQKG